MMNKVVFCSLFLAAIATGLASRLVRLEIRPMHHDEANQAVKFGTLLETGEYRYDRNDHHGPTLYYLTLPSAWARGQRTLAELDERTLRVVPALLGAGIIPLFVFLARGLGRSAVLFGALFAAVSPVMTYYSRFYIQESLFVFFILGFVIALGHYVLSPGIGWALAAGIFAGLMYATKETAILVFIASGAALALSLFWTKAISRSAQPRAGAPRIKAAQILLGLAAALIIAILFYSSFLRNPRGVLESVWAFQNYAVRATESGLHAHPWYYYLKILAFSSWDGFVWTEGMILILAVVGAIFTVGRAYKNQELSLAGPGHGDSARKRFWPRYILLYSLLTVTAFSILRYKTPWNLLPFHLGFILLAGHGAATLLRTLKSRLHRNLLLIILFAGFWHLGLENWRANYLYPADPRNPYVYAQTLPDFLRLAKRIHDLASVHPQGKDMLIKVVAGPYEQWPLPWYLRDLRRVGYWTDVGSAGGFEEAAVIISSQDNRPKLEVAIGDRYQAEFYGLRPDVLLTIYIDRPLWERFLNRR